MINPIEFYEPHDIRRLNENNVVGIHIVQPDSELAKEGIIIILSVFVHKAMPILQKQLTMEEVRRALDCSAVSPFIKENLQNCLNQLN